MQLFYYTAKWCVPCKTFGPIVAQVAEKLNLAIEKIDIDEQWDKVPDTVRGVPTIIMYDDDNNEDGRVVGARSAQDLESWIKGE